MPRRTKAGASPLKGRVPEADPLEQAIKVTQRKARCPSKISEKGSS